MQQQQLDLGSDQIVDLLVVAWSDALGTTATRDSDFFELGGTSLSAISIAGRVAEHYSDFEGVGPRALQAVFACPSLAAMADELAAFLCMQRPSAC